MQPEAVNVTLSTGRHYNNLSDGEKILYEAFYKAIMSGYYVPFSQKDSNTAYQSKWYAYYAGNFVKDYCSGLDSMNTLINRACEAVYYDHPEKVELYMVYPCKYSYSSSNNKSVIALSARVDDSKFAAYDAQITSKLNSHANAVRTAGFELILNRIGIPAMVITGKAGKASQLGGHAWNIVNLDGNWYEVDTTWDDKDDVNNINHLWFNRTTNEFANGIAATGYIGYHIRSAGFSFIGFRMPLAKGKHWTYSYLASTRNYTKDPNVWALGISAPNSINTYVGSTFTVPVTFNPAGTTNKGYTLTSSDTSVVSTNGTTAVALKRGAVILTIVSADGSYRASTSVWVRDPLYAKFGYGGNTYEVSSENSVELVKAGSVSNVVIPEYVYFSGKNYPVTKISNKAFKNNKSVTSVSGGKNIREIGYYAFSGCSKLKSVKLKGACIREIGYKAFYNCKKLSTIEFNGSKLSSIDEMAFKGINKKAKFRIKASKSKFNKVVKLVKGAGAKKATYKRG